MNRNVESHFSQLPAVDIQRSIFDRSSGLKTSFNAGELIPIYIDEVLPGDSFEMTSSKVVRAQTMLTPVMDNMYLDIYWFFVRMDQVWTHAHEFFGENTQSAWIPEVEYQIPSISSPETGFERGTLADYFGLPITHYDETQEAYVPVIWNNEAKRRPSALPFRAYARICDEWFRDENLTDPLNIPYGDSNQEGSNGSDYINDVANGGKPFKVAKYHDYFTSALPNAQKGPPVTFGADPIVTYSANKMPVGTSNPAHSGRLDDSSVLIFKDTYSGQYRNLGTLANNTWGNNGVNYAPNSDGNISYGAGEVPVNLYADPTNAFSFDVSGVSFTINELRLAFQLQKWYEKAARGGTRYVEILKSHFGVTSEDQRILRTQYLGGNRIPLNVHEVTNSAQSEQDFLGDLGAKSATSDIHEDFRYSFTSHGYIIGVCCVRYDHTYSQGLERFWSRRSKFDFYWPVFANLGETGIFDSELYADNDTMANDTIFGFQEAWADYRYKPSRCSGYMRPDVNENLAVWHFADNYTQKPVLSDSWIREDKTNIDRTLAVTSQISDQFFADFYFKCICTRAMPTYSIPGLIDHH